MSTLIKVNRVCDLFDVLRYCSDQQLVGRPACFSVSERICINQERGALFSQLNTETPDDEKRFYQCPPKLEVKIRFVIQKIIDINLITN